MDQVAERRKGAVPAVAICVLVGAVAVAGSVAVAGRVTGVG
jgi:hypothetical protein